MTTPKVLSVAAEPTTHSLSHVRIQLDFSTLSIRCGVRTVRGLLAGSIRSRRETGLVRLLGKWLGRWRQLAESAETYAVSMVRPVTAVLG